MGGGNKGHCTYLLKYDVPLLRFPFCIKGLVFLSFELRLRIPKLAVASGDGDAGQSGEDSKGDWANRGNQCQQHSDR